MISLMFLRNTTGNVSYKYSNSQSSSYSQNSDAYERRYRQMNKFEEILDYFVKNKT